MKIDTNKVIQFTIILIIPFLIDLLEKSYNSFNTKNTNNLTVETPIVTVSKNNFNITIKINNINNLNNIKIALFNSKNGFPYDYKKAMIFVSKNIDNNSTIYVFNNIKPGRYAIIAFIDENNNNKLDTDIFGIPKEKYGLSLNPYVKFKIPSFYKCSFLVNNDVGLTINIK